MECLRRSRHAAFVKSLRCLENEKYTEKFFLYSASPVLAGIRPAVLVSFQNCCREAWLRCSDSICRESGLSARMLYEKNGMFSLLIYNRRHLEMKAGSPKSREILDTYGYPASCGADELLSRLTERSAGCRFPHEIGVFLGYPPDDVISFIEKKGRNYLCCRYWKVYHDEVKAEEIFRRIDDAKSEAVSLIIRKIPLKAAAEKLAGLQTI